MDLQFEQSHVHRASIIQRRAPVLGVGSSISEGLSPHEPAKHPKFPRSSKNPKPHLKPHQEPGCIEFFVLKYLRRLTGFGLSLVLWELGIVEDPLKAECY